MRLCRRIGAPGARGMSKFTPLDERLHAYAVDHGARQDEVCSNQDQKAEN